MITAIFIVTYAKDFPFLKYCLRSIDKFATGFTYVGLLVPNQDKGAALLLATENCKNVPIKIFGGEEWEKKGFLWHMAQIMRADEWCDDVDFIAHFDPDCVFTAPVTPGTFIKDGKPVLQYEKFSSIGHRHPGVLQWQENTQRCLPFDVFYETMRGHPEIYHHALYEEARRKVELKTGLPIDYYIQQGRNGYPQDFCEFVTLGNVAMHDFPNQYTLVDNSKKPNPDKSDFPVFQAWSHARPDEDVELWIEGVKTRATPIKIWERLGLL